MSILSKILTLFVLILFILMISSIIIFVPIEDVSNQVESTDNINETQLNELTYNNLNNERTQRNISELSQDNDIEEVAEYKTDNMISKDYIDHESPSGESVNDRFSNFNVNCQSVGENIAKTFYDRNVNTEYKDETVNYKSMEELSEGIVTQFMNSQSHKENLLDENWEYHGLSIKVTSNNEVYATHKFCN